MSNSENDQGSGASDSGTARNDQAELDRLLKESGLYPPVPPAPTTASGEAPWESELRPPPTRDNDPKDRRDDGSWDLLKHLEFVDLYLKERRGGEASAQIPDDIRSALETIDLSDTEDGVYSALGFGMEDRSERELARRIAAKSINTGELIRIASGLELKLKHEGTMAADPESPFRSVAGGRLRFAQEMSSGVEMALMQVGSSSDIPEAQREDAKAIYKRVRAARRVLRELSPEESRLQSAAMPAPRLSGAYTAPERSRSGTHVPPTRSETQSGKAARTTKSVKAVPEESSLGRTIALIAILVVALVGAGIFHSRMGADLEAEDLTSQVSGILPVTDVAAYPDLIQGTVTSAWKAMSASEQREAIAKALETLDRPDAQLLLRDENGKVVAVARDGRINLL